MANIKTIYKTSAFLLEGALGARLKREYGIYPDDCVALAAHVYNEDARAALTELWNGYIGIAKNYKLPFLATTPTRRANRESVAASRYGGAIIADNIKFLKSIQRQSGTEMYAGALVGCKGDAYTATGALSELESESFHSWEAEMFAAGGVDFFYAGIMPALPEAAGMAKALSKTRIPYIVSFMVKDNGRLIDGTTINDAIAYIDDITDPRPLCYMTNCVHPDILYRALSCGFNQTPRVRSRFCGIQANASPLAPEQLDNSVELQASNPNNMADSLSRLKEWISLKIVGGCCGTDNEYMSAIAKVVAT